MKNPFKKKQQTEDEMVAGYLTGYLYQNHVTFDYLLPECWETFKSKYLERFYALLQEINADADNVDFHIEHLECEYKKALSMLEIQHQHNVNIINKATNRREADLNKAQQELNELMKHLSILDNADQELIEIRRTKNENKFSFF